MNKKKLNILLPMAFSLLLIGGMQLGFKLNDSLTNKPSLSIIQEGPYDKLQELLGYISVNYMDTISRGALTEHAVLAIISHLDPHSSYIPAANLRMISEQLEGEFEGIGIEFYILNDTILVVTAFAGGPSEALGVRSGDKIIKIEDTVVAGTNITNREVMHKLKGKKGTRVKVAILRKGIDKLIDYVIVRDKIPIYSVDIGYMIDDETGYIKISRFAGSTYEEFMEKLETLLANNMQRLIIDVRGNPGGYLNEATRIADELLDYGKLIVYTKGKENPRYDYVSKKKGKFMDGKVVILIDEGSASASEILAGAIQDNDRGIIVGRRSFAKGLVQEQYSFEDGSALRLSVAKYYTPTGRSIQKSYQAGMKDYEEEVFNRYGRGELVHEDSIQLIDSLKYITSEGKVVYGGGGIMPDIFVPIDTLATNKYLRQLLVKGVIIEFCYDYYVRHKELIDSYKDFNDFNRNFNIDNKRFNEFIDYAQKQGVNKDKKLIATSEKQIKIRIKAYIARQKWQNDGFYRVIHKLDKTLQKAHEVICLFCVASQVAD